MNQDTYDLVPYGGQSIPRSQPSRLEILGRLFGLNPSPAEACRVLELGCAIGRNLIPVAESFPNSRFVGVDLSELQVNDARATCTRANVTNAEFHAMSIADVNDDFGQFNYVICHGVFSWVPEEIQEAILRVCSKNLAPNGIAYISYNTYPGWYLRHPFRDMLAYHTRNVKGHDERVRKARGFIEFLHSSEPHANEAFTQAIQMEYRRLEEKPDSYVFHELLEENNRPLYFTQFMQRAHKHGLQFLSESDLAYSLMLGFDADTKQRIHESANGVWERQQYADFVTGHMFRATVLCHQATNVDRSLQPDCIPHLYIAGFLRPPETGFDLYSAEEVPFTGSKGQRIRTAIPQIKAAFLILAERWPRSIHFDELWKMALDRVGPSSKEAARQTSHRTFCDGILYCFLSDAIELRSHADGFVSHISSRPSTSELARVEASRGEGVTNRKHETLNVPENVRRLMSQLDGSRSRGELLTLIAKNWQAQDVPNSLESNKQDFERTLDEELQTLARRAFLIG